MAWDIYGPHGPEGPQGDRGLNWKNAGWVTATDYVVDDALSHNGVSYRCYVAHTSGASTEPGVGASWADNWKVLAGAGGTHNILSATHLDADAADVPAGGDILTWDAAAGKWKASPASGGGGGGLLAVIAYAPGTETTTDITGTAWADFDATNLAITFTPPASGNVLVMVTGHLVMPSATTYTSQLGLREATTVVAESRLGSVASGTNNIGELVTAQFYLTGVTAGAKTYKLAASNSVGGGVARLLSGPTRGKTVMTVWSA